MRRTLWLFALSMLLALPMAAATAVPMDLLSKPVIMIVKYDKLYVLEGTTVFIHDLGDFSLIRKFGKAGEGPQEFKYNGNDARPLSMSFDGDRLLVNSVNKLSFFNPEGEYTGEKKVPVDLLLFPLGQRYVGIGPMNVEDGQNLLGFRILNEKCEPGPILCALDLALNNPDKIVLPMVTFTYNPVYRDRVYINTSPDKFVIEVFDGEGKRVEEISKSYEPLEFTEKDQAMTHDFFRNHPMWKRQYEYIRKSLRFRDHFPPIRDLQITEDRIYALTYRREGALWELISLGLDGTELGRTFIPLGRYIPFSFYPVLYSVYHGNVYTLVENEDEEVWELHTTPLNQ